MFSACQGSDQILGCPCTLNCDLDLSKGNIVKSSIEDIYYNTSERINAIVDTNWADNQLTNKSDVQYVGTPRQLLYLCLNSYLEDEYKDGKLIGDIFLFSRNISTCLDNENSLIGIKMILGETINFKSNNNDSYIRFIVPSEGKKITAKVYMTEDQMNAVKKYILEIYDNKFGGHSIAVFDNWSISRESDAQIECRLNTDKNLIYRFNH